MNHRGSHVLTAVGAASRYGTAALTAAAVITVGAVIGIGRLATVLESHPRITLSVASKLVKEYCELDAEKALVEARKSWPGITRGEWSASFLLGTLGPSQIWPMPPGALMPEDGMTEDEKEKDFLSSPIMPDGKSWTPSQLFLDYGVHPPGDVRPEHATGLDAILNYVVLNKHLENGVFRNISFQQNLAMKESENVYHSDIETGALTAFERLNGFQEHAAGLSLWAAVDGNCDVAFGKVAAAGALNLFNSSWLRHIESWPFGSYVFTFTNTAIQGPGDYDRPPAVSRDTVVEIEPRPPSPGRLQMSVWVPVSPSGTISAIQLILTGWTVFVLALGMAFVWKRARPLVTLEKTMGRAGDLLRTAKQPQFSLRELADEKRLSSNEPAIKECRIMLHELSSLLGERDAWLANFAHELKNDIIAAELGLKNSFRAVGSEHVPDTARHLDHAASKLQNVMHYQRTLFGTPDLAKSTDLTSLLLGIADKIEDMGGVAVCEVEGGLAVQGLPDPIQSALENLAVNAYHHGGGTVRITARKDARAASAEILVDDYGPGITGDQKEKVFKPYSWGKKSQGSSSRGAGLGMSIARNVVDSHDGKLTLENRRTPDGDVEGLRVRITLPLANHDDARTS